MDPIARGKLTSYDINTAIAEYLGYTDIYVADTVEVYAKAPGEDIRTRLPNFYRLKDAMITPIKKLAAENVDAFGLFCCELGEGEVGSKVQMPILPRGCHDDEANCNCLEFLVGIGYALLVDAEEVAKCFVYALRRI